MRFEERFFGPGNRLRWTAIESGSLPPTTQERLAPFLEDLRRNPDVLILPRVREDGRVQWYILCSSERVGRIARDELRSFLGRSYSNFEGRPTCLDPADDVDAAVLERCGTSAFRLEIPDDSLIDAARERLNLMRRLRSERPTRSGQRIRATGRILRDFEYALLAKDSESASACIAELRATGRLGAANLLFLEVRRLAALGLWSAILTLPDLPSLLGMHRPRRVTEALVQAVYRALLQGFEDSGRVADAIDYFRSELLPRYSDLYRSRVGLSGFEVDASFLLVAVAADPPRREQADAILKDFPTTDPRRTYLEAIGATLAGVAAPLLADQLEDARASFYAADVDRAYELAQAAPPSYARAVLLLRCAREMGTIAAAQFALAAVAALSAAENAKLQNHAVLSRVHEALLDFLAPPLARTAALVRAEEVPTSWPAWLHRLTLEERWASAVTIAETGAREWNVGVYLGEGSLVSETADILFAPRPAWGQEALRDSLPYLLEFFARQPDVRLKPIYENLFLVIVLDDQMSLPQFRALLRVAEVRLELGVSAAEYKEIVSQLVSAMEALGSPAAADVALDAIDGLISVSCPDPSERQCLASRVQGLFQRWYRRIDASQWALLQRFCEELEVPVTVPRPSTDGEEGQARFDWKMLAGKRVALYSLREAALRRAEAILRDLCPGIHVQVFADPVGGSPALRTAVRTADLFVLATAAAKHAATQFIEAHRPKGKVILYARSQGSASLLKVLREHLKREAYNN